MKRVPKPKPLKGAAPKRSRAKASMRDPILRARLGLPRPGLDIGYKAARRIESAHLYGALRTFGLANKTQIAFEAEDDVAAEVSAALISTMLANGSGERINVGEIDLVVLRFVVIDKGNRPISYLVAEGYNEPCPVFVEGHVVDRAGAVSAWLSEADPEDHPGLFLARVPAVSNDFLGLCR